MKTAKTYRIESNYGKYLLTRDYGKPLVRYTVIAIWYDPVAFEAPLGPERCEIIGEELPLGYARKVCMRHEAQLKALEEKLF